MVREVLEVGVVVERRVLQNPWVDHAWKPVAVLPGAPAAAPWTILAETPRDKGFGNARFIRNVFEAAVSNQASRLVHVDEPDAEQLTTLVADDLPAP